jgi:ATP-binding cassette, subfamily B, bacterial
VTPTPESTTAPPVGPADQGAVPEAKSSLASLGFLLGTHRLAIGLLAFTSVLSGVAEATLLAAIAQIGAALLDGAHHVNASLGPLDVRIGVNVMVAVAAAMAVVRIGLQAAISYLQATTAGQVQASLRNDLTSAYTKASWAVQSRDGEGHLQEMLTSQVIQATQGTLQIAMLLSSLLTFAILLLSAMLLNVVAASVVIVVAVLLFALLRPLSALGRRRSRELSQAQMVFAGGVGEASRMAEENHVFGVGEVQQAQLESLVSNAQGLFFRTQMVGKLVPGVYQGMIYLTVVAGLGVLYATGSGQVASLGAVVLLLVRAGTYGQQIQSAYQTALQALPFAERVRDATAHYERNAATSDGNALTAIDSLAFSHVSFSYRSRQPVLTDISFEIRRPEVVGVIGPSGAGKSTLIQLLLRLREPVSGSYLVNGLPAVHWSIDDWHRQVAYVPQEPRLLHATVVDNIRFRREIPLEQVERAAKLARIHDEIVSWSDGYETLIGPRADSVSGGQQQRICLARALASLPSMLVLDEPTSSLDPKSEALIQDSLDDLAKEMTLIIVTHRMSALSSCDRVMVISDHAIEAFDTLGELQETNSYVSAASAISAGARA